MLTVMGAMKQEIGLALGLCAQPQRLPLRGIMGWQATRKGQVFHLLKTGMGPRRAALQLRRYLASYHPSQILIAGYGGALDPALQLGDIVVVRCVSMLGMNCEAGFPLEEMQVEGSWRFSGVGNLARIAGAAGIRAVEADAVTVPFIVGEPAQKRGLRERVGASVVDMESAVIASAAAAAGIAVGCVRAISDESGHDFLAPFSYSPQAGITARALRVAVASQWYGRYRAWREGSERAGQSLRAFLAEYFGCEMAEAGITPSLRSE